MSGHPIHDSFRYLSPSPLCEPKTWQETYRSPLELNCSSDTVHHHNYRKPSLSSKDSFAGAVSRSLRVANENVSSSRTTSLSTLDLLDGSTHPPPLNQPSEATSHKSSWTRENRVPNTSGTNSASTSDAGTLEVIDLNARCGEISQRSSSGTEVECWQQPDHGPSFEIEEKETLSTKKLPPTPAQEDGFCRPSFIVTDTTSHPIRRLLSTLRHRHSKRRRSLSARKERWSLDDSDEDLSTVTFQSQHVKPSGHKKTSSWASSGFVAAVKPATTNLGTLSASQSQISRRFAPMRNSKRSSKLSQVTNRESVDGNQDFAPIVDEAAWDRAVQRRRTLEELIGSEGSYIADLKVLKNVSVPSYT